MFLHSPWNVLAMTNIDLIASLLTVNHVDVAVWILMSMLSRCEDAPNRSPVVHVQFHSFLSESVS